MTRTSVFLHRVAALSAAAALFASPVAAQTPDSPPREPPAARTLLSSAAFARLVHGSTVHETVPIAKEPPRRDLLREAATAARRAADVSAQPPRRSGTGWSKAGKVALGVGIVLGVLAGLGAASYYTGVDFMPIFDALFRGA